MKKTLLSISLVSLFTALAGSAMALEQRPVLIAGCRQEDGGGM